jgi:hypothetical protein
MPSMGIHCPKRSQITRRLKQERERIALCIKQQFDNPSGYHKGLNVLIL